MKKRYFLLNTCTLFLSACTSDKASKATTSEVEPVDVSKALFHNPDSLNFYAAIAYKDDDPKGLFVTGAAAYLRAQDPNFPDSCTTVSLDEADIMLLHAAELGNSDALKLIRCLDAHGQWKHSIPEPK